MILATATGNQNAIEIGIRMIHQRPVDPLTDGFEELVSTSKNASLGQTNPKPP